MNEFISGSISGIASLFVSQPFDTIKVNIQTRPTVCPTITKAITNIIKNDGFLGFFKGIVPPIFGVGLISGTTFGIYSKSTKFYKKYTDNYLLNSFFSGLNVGCITSMIISPTELLKTKLQTSNSYKGNFDCLQKVYSHQGIPGLYSGLTSTLMRDGFGFGVYFFTYELLHSHWGDSNLALLNAGGFAGTLTWLTVYPFDVVKSRIQSLPETSKDFKLNTFKGVRDIYTKEGIRSLYRGLFVCSLRAYPVNAVTFFIYEKSKKVLNKHFNI